MKQTWRQVKKNGHLEWELTPKTKDEILKDAGKYSNNYEKENGFGTHPKTASFHGYIAGYDGSNEGHKEIARARGEAINELQAENERLKGKVEELEKFLKDHEQWEADFISENSMWWPNREEDALNGKLYESFLELQDKRNLLLNTEQNPQASVATEDDSSNEAG